MSVAQVLDAAADRYPDEPAMICETGTITFRELRDRARRIAGGLQREGIREGDRVGLWMHNEVDIAAATYGAAYAGALLVPMNTWHRTREMSYAVAQSEISLLIVGATIGRRSGAEAVADLIGGGTFPSPDFPHLTTIIYAAPPPSGRSLDDLMAGAELTPVPPSMRSPRFMLYTSGTTGAAKGVLLDDEGSVRDATGVGDRLGMVPGDRYYCPVPLFHAGGLTFVLLAAHLKGAAVVTRRQFDPAEAIEDIERHGCTITGGFEVQYARMVVAVGERGVPAPASLRAGWWVGSPAAFLRTEQELGLRLSNFYGMTEASGNVAGTPLDWPAEERAQNQGEPMEGRTIHIVDPHTDEDLPVGSVGEIRVSGWGLTQGYWNKPAETAAKFDASGRLRSGDSGFVDEWGRLHFLGRADDAVKVGGENVAPMEVEEVLAEHPAVEEAVVTGVPDDIYGQVLAAFVLLRPEAEVSDDDLRCHVRDRLASFKVPRIVRQVTDLPRTSTGKVRKGELVSLIEHRPTTSNSLSTHKMQEQA